MNGNGYNTPVIHHRRYRLFFLAALFPLFISCLSVEVDLDLRQENRQELTMRYTMARQLWELGVFDQDSPERAVPVSRRDVEETALRHPGVTVQDFSISEGETRVTVTVRYRADSFAGLQGVWGEAGRDPLTMRRNAASGVSTLSLPFAPGGVAPDGEQLALMEEVFSGHRTKITVRLPGSVAAASVSGAPPGEALPQVDRSTVVMEASMALVATSATPLVLEVTW